MPPETTTSGPTARRGGSFDSAEEHRLFKQLSDVLRVQFEQLEEMRKFNDRLRRIDEHLSNACKPLLTVAEAARLFDRCEDTIRRWIKLKKLKADRVEGTGPRGRLLIRREALVALLEHGVGEDIPAVAISASPTSTDK